MTQSEFESVLGSHLNKEPDAVRFFLAWNSYCHAVDDVVDDFSLKGLPVPAEVLLRLLVQAAALYSSNFYQRYATQLYPLVLTITNAYADSVKWEKSDHSAKLQMADSLRTYGNEMLLTVIGLVEGWETLREISPLLREHSWNCHHDETGKPT